MRALRISNREKIKRRLKRKLFWLTDCSEKELNILVDSRPRCSCSMCGNPRRHKGELSLQERRIKEGRYENIARGERDN